MKLLALRELVNEYCDSWLSIARNALAAASNVRPRVCVSSPGVLARQNVHRSLTRLLRPLRPPRSLAYTSFIPW